MGLHTNSFVGGIPNLCPVAEHATCKEVWYHQLAARKPTCSNTLRNMFFFFFFFFFSENTCATCTIFHVFTGAASCPSRSALKIN